MLNKQAPIPGEYGYDKRHPFYESIVLLRKQLELAIKLNEIPVGQESAFRADLSAFTHWRSHKNDNRYII